MNRRPFGSSEMRSLTARASQSLCLHHAGCRDFGRIVVLDAKQPEQRIACWFVLFDTKARATVIGFERAEDANTFRPEFVGTARIARD